MIYELRRYEALPGKMEALNNVMNNVAIPLFKELDMQVIGAWQPLIGDYNNVLMYILAYDSMEERNKKWEAFYSHADWKAEIARREGPNAMREIYSFLNPTSYSPLQ